MSSISLCVPMFRSAAFLPDLVRRLSGLDPGPDEIVFLDDASPDDSGKLLRDLADAASPRLDCRLITHDTNAGIAASYNRLVREAAGEWVHILDADDYPVERDFYARMSAAFSRECDLVVAAVDSNSALLGRGSRALGWMVPANPPPWLPLLGSFATRSGIVYRRATVAGEPFPDPAFPGSDVVHFISLRSKRNCRFVHDAHVYYRVHRSAASSQARSYRQYRAALSRFDAATRFAHTIDLGLRIVGQAIHRS